MANNVGIPSGTTISGVELTSVTVTGKVDTLIIDPDTEKTIPTHAYAYNETYELSFEGIDVGFQATTSSASVLGKTFKLTLLQDMDSSTRCSHKWKLLGVQNNVRNF